MRSVRADRILRHPARRNGKSGNKNREITRMHTDTHESTQDNEIYFFFHKSCPDRKNTESSNTCNETIWEQVINRWKKTYVYSLGLYISLIFPLYESLFHVSIRHSNKNTYNYKEPLTLWHLDWDKHGPNVRKQTKIGPHLIFCKSP